MTEEVEKPYVQVNVEGLDLLLQVVGYSRRENRDRQAERERNQALRGSAAGAVEEAAGQGVEMQIILEQHYRAEQPEERRGAGNRPDGGYTTGKLKVQIGGSALGRMSGAVKRVWIRQRGHGSTGLDTPGAGPVPNVAAGSNWFCFRDRHIPDGGSLCLVAGC
jgi:hypothetical protein